MSRFDPNFLPIQLKPEDVSPGEPQTGLNTLPSFLQKAPDPFDTDLRFYDALLHEQDITDIYEKPVLNKEVVDYVKGKLEIQEDFDFENFVMNTIGSTTDKDKHFILNKFPEIIKKKEIPPLAKIELHNKVAKFVINGLKTEDDFILLYLISKNKVPIDSFLLTNILKGIGYTSLDQFTYLNILKANGLDFSAIINLPNGQIDSNVGVTKPYQGPPKREPLLTDPYKNMIRDTQNYKTHYAEDDNRFKQDSVRANFFGVSNQQSQRFTNNWFLNLPR